MNCCKEWKWIWFIEDLILITYNITTTKADELKKSMNINFLCIFKVLPSTIQLEYRLWTFGAVLLALMKRTNQKQAVKHQTRMCMQFETIHTNEFGILSDAIENHNQTWCKQLKLQYQNEIHREIMHRFFNMNNEWMNEWMNDRYVVMFVCWFRTFKYLNIWIEWIIIYLCKRRSEL
jgi:hypothetical protein